jgi:glycosyltransferase 2 family protein
MRPFGDQNARGRYLVKRLSGSVGLIIGVAGAFFVVRELARHWDEVRATAEGANLGPLVLAFAVGSLGMLTIGLGWRSCLSTLGVPRPALDTLRRYYVGQLGKYVPGGIWPVVGRAEMARRGGVPGAVAYGSTVLSLGLTYLAAVLTALGALLAGAGGGEQVRWEPVIALLPLGILALHPRVVGLVLETLRKVSRRELDVPIPRWRSSVSLLFRHVPAWLAVGGATWLVAVALGASQADGRNLLFAATLSWVVGFLAVPVPGGIGVREAVFVAAATSLPSTGVAAAVALVARLLFILVDTTGAGATSLAAAVRPAGAATVAGAGPDRSAEDGDVLP